MIRQKEAGFSAIELLITLFVLAAFLIAGVQLYNVVINDGAASRAESRASNIAYSYLRQYSTSAESPCEPSTVVDGESIQVEGLVDVSVTVIISCPYGTSSLVSKVEVAISYNRPSETVTHATYVNDGSGVASSVTDGLIAWWKLNGNAEDSIRGGSGTVSGAAPTTGQDGRPNGAYTFDGTDDYIELSPALTSFSNFSVSVWARGVPGPSATSGHGYIIHRSIDTSQGNSVYWLAAGGSGYYGGDVSGVASPTSAWISSVPTGSTTWRSITLTFDGSTRRVYVDGVLESSFSRSFTNTTSGTRLALGGTAHNGSYRPFQGQIDDVRIYNKALSSTEIQTLFNEGAF